MKYEIIIAGFGGQGILFSGQLLAYAAMLEGYEVSWLPSYGPEMRGGTANCNVVISDRKIRSPLVQQPNGLIAMNKPSLDKFEKTMKHNGILVMNTSMIDRSTTRHDIMGIEVEADEIADRIGSKKVSNLVALGVLIGATNILKEESLLTALDKTVSKAHANLIPLNMNALKSGIELSNRLMMKGAV
jgi:2-oxoglutarate ferredoxin oxidoreductase subunit gamma